MSEIVKTIKEHVIFLILMVLIVVIGILGVIYQPHGKGITALQNTHFVAGYSIQALILLWSIGFYLLYRWWNKGKTNRSNLIWSISFLLYSLVFVGLFLQSFGISWANSNEPLFFFIWRQFMILFIAGLYYGTSILLTDKKKLQIIPTIIIIIISYVWFALGIFVIDSANPVELTMYGFLYFGLIPVGLLIAYMWFTFSKRYKLSSAYLLSSGFVWFSVTYACWAPWHFSDVIYIYFIWFALFILSLVLMLLGFVILPFERSKSTTS